VTLCGESRDSVAIETSRYAPFTSPFPEDALLKPPADYPLDPERNFLYMTRAGFEMATKEVRGKVTDNRKLYIAHTGYPIDWLPEYNERSVMVRIQNRSGLENLTFEVTATRQICQIVLVGGKAGAECEDVVIDKCRFLAESTGLYGEWPYFYTSDGIRVASPVRYFKFTRNEFSLNDAAISFLPARHWDGSISFNRFTTADPHAAFITIGCGGERVLFQGNVFENTGRGKTGGAVYYEPRPVQHSLYLQNILKNLRKSDGEMILYETGSAAAWGKAAGGGAASLQSKPETPWEKDKWRDHRVVISQGRGMGQIRWITGNTADALEVAEPWLVAPDSSSTFCIMTAETLENLHVGNEYFYCHQWSGVYGAGLRNVWANNEMESVGGGDYLWKIHGLRQMSLNLHLGNRYHERARIAFANSRCDNKGALAKEDVVQMFGNEIRQCFFRRPSYVATENGPDGGIGSIRGKIRTGGKAGNPLQPIPGEEPGIGIFEDTAHPSTCDVDNPILDTLPIANRWNLVADCTFMQCPVGILIGRRVENTVLSGNTFYDCHVPVKDGGLSTIRTDDMYWTAFQAYQAGTNKGTAK
ncbi:MAG: hypothetical protein Q8O57_11465, partial [Kiritimatiellota bacterium]|nr:hypothetical protein [Kiritimatiellota bacterium]